MIQRLLKQLSGQELHTDKLRVAQLVRALKGQSYYVPPVMHKIRSRKILGPLAQQLQNTGKSKPVQNVINSTPTWNQTTKPRPSANSKDVPRRETVVQQAQEALLRKQKESVKY